MAYIPSYNEKSFIIDGKNTFIHSAAIHYYRFPREEWREVLWKAKLAGVTCIDTYFAWNVHEPHKGEWDFSGNYDCDAFLSLCHELGLQVIARPGPYICAEWDFGGLPWWLTNEEPMSYRDFDAAFLLYVDRYFDQLIPIISRHQSSRGGSVILVQVENEYQHLRSDEDGREYLEYLRDGLIRRGIDVPLISCEGGVEGAIECANFWSGADAAYAKLRQKQPDTPKIVTEFWTGWFEKWGGARADHKTPELLERRMMEVLQAGYTGINHYMFCGGTNFGDYGGRTVDGSDVFMVTSYDYDAPLNEYLGFTPKYHVVKRMGYFIQSIESFLLASQEVPANVRMSQAGEIRKRVQGDTALYFVQHSGMERETIAFTTDEGETYHVTVNPRQIMPVIVDLNIMPRWQLTYNAYLGGLYEIGDVPTLVVYAEQGQRSRLKLRSDTALQVHAPTSVQWTYAEERNEAAFDLYHFASTQVIELRNDEQTLRIIVLSSQAMDRVWWLHDDVRGTSLVLGADGITELDGRIRPEVTTTLPSQIEWFGYRSLFDDHSQTTGGEKIGHHTRELSGYTGLFSMPTLDQWEMMREDLQDDSASTYSRSPIGFSEMKRPSGHLVYSTTVYSEAERVSTLVMPDTQDTVRVFVNGEHHTICRDTFGTAVTIPLQAGNNRIDLLVQHMGRFNFSFYLGESKGIYGPVYVDGAKEDIRAAWQDENGLAVHLDQVNQGIQGRLLKRVISKSSNERLQLIGELTDTLLINGQAIDLGPYHSWYKIGSIELTPYLHEGDNVIEMKGYRAPVERLELLRWYDEHEVIDWQIRVVDRPQLSAAWEPIDHHRRESTSPTWYRCTFSKPELPQHMQAKLKLQLTGMSKGSIWLNGKNLGRYWQIGPQEDYKVPTEWLLDENELILFDEIGALPDDVRLRWEQVSIIM